jgi:hypothetical protein
LLRKIRVIFEIPMAVAMKNAFFWDGLQLGPDLMFIGPFIIVITEE